MNEENLLHWIALTRVEGIGTRLAHRLIEKFGTPEAVFQASLTELERCGLRAPSAQGIFRQAGMKEAEEELERLAKTDAQLLTFGDARYPARLREIPDPPVLLYIRGSLEAVRDFSISMVGTRRPTPYGSGVTLRLARDLAQRNFVIVSGMARGIDSAAHKGALEANGRTVAVFGTGIDVIYPRYNAHLAEQILERGAWVSEFPLGTSPQPENFPIRNRMISGLSLGTVVVEGAEYSGSLITARLAADQNREVFAVPGNITTAQSFGPNHLIKSGVKLVDCWQDVLEELPAEIRNRLAPPTAENEAATSEPRSASLFDASFTADQKAVFGILKNDEPLFIDSIYGDLDLAPPRILTALLELEMSGMIRQLPGKNFLRRL